MRSGSNKQALKALFTLLLSTVVIFLAETKFLVAEVRGTTLSQYENIRGINKVLLLVEDFEGLKGDSISLQKDRFFSYGSAKITLDSSNTDKALIASKNTLKINWNGKETYGGWGKGVGKNIDLNTETDHLNFRVYIPKTNGDKDIIKIIVQEDDNNDGILQQDKDDSWYYNITLPTSDKWQFISVPLKDFTDGNPGGDGVLNVLRKGGLHNIIFSFEQPEKYTTNSIWYFDFICFTNGKVTDDDLK
ncbi:MAG TPA: hypothetical protein VN026_10475 [Bacteroidia bacterium]|nr:hypothetical protein [Bacteroidia bacterium]